VLNQGRSEIASRVKTSMQHILDRYKTGMNITTVNLQNVQPPDQVQSAFDDAVRAGQDRERSKNEGQAYANDVVPKAKGVAARLIEEANGYKQSVIATAQGDSARFRQILSEYEKAPQVTRERMYLETMQQILSTTSKVIVDQKGGQNLLYLPLDRLMQMTGTVTTSSDTPLRSAMPSSEPAAPSAVSPAVPDVTRGRETLRTRDREAR
jgi:modulator of FtsH protease HflK